MRPEHFYQGERGGLFQADTHSKEAGGTGPKCTHSRKGNQGQSEQAPVGWPKESASHAEGTWEPSVGCERETGCYGEGMGAIGGAKGSWRLRPLQPCPYLVDCGQDPAVALAEGTDLGHLPGHIVGEAKLHKLALQGRDCSQYTIRPQETRKRRRGWGPWEWGLS